MAAVSKSGEENKVDSTVKQNKLLNQIYRRIQEAERFEDGVPCLHPLCSLGPGADYGGMGGPLQRER